MSHKELICKHCPSIVLKPNTGEYLADRKDCLPISKTAEDKTEFTGWVYVKVEFQHHVATPRWGGTAT